MDDNEFQVNKQFADFKGKDVIISLKNRDEYSGNIVTIDNFLNIVLETEDGLKVIKGGKISFISLQEEN